MWRKTKVEVQLVFQPWFCSRNVWERFFVVKSTCTAWDGCKLLKIHDPRETKDIIEMAAMMISITAIVWYATENTVTGRTLDWLVLEGFDEYLETNGNELTWFYEIYLSWLKIRDVPLKKDRFPVIAICCMLSWLAYFRLLATLDVTKAFSNGCFTQVFIPQDLTTKRHSILLKKEDQSRAKVPNESLNDLSWFLNFNPTKIGPKNHALPLLSLSVWLGCRVYPMTPPVKTSGVTFNLRDFATITAWHPH